MNNQHRSLYAVDVANLIGGAQHHFALLSLSALATVVSQASRALIFHTEGSAFTAGMPPNAKVFDYSATPLKNLDVALAVETGAYLRSDRYYDRFVLYSGDGDFSPLLERARERGIHTTVRAFRPSLSHLLADSADAVELLGNELLLPRPPVTAGTSGQVPRLGYSTRPQLELRAS